MSDIETTDPTPDKQPPIEKSALQDSPERIRSESLKREVYDRMNAHINETTKGTHTVLYQEKDFSETAQRALNSTLLDSNPEIPNDPTSVNTKEIVMQVRRRVNDITEAEHDGTEEAFTGKYSKIAYLADDFFKNPKKRSEILPLIEKAYGEINDSLGSELEKGDTKRTSVLNEIDTALGDLGAENSRKYNETISKRDTALLNKWENTQSHIAINRLRYASEDLEKKRREIRNYENNLKDLFKDDSRIILSRLEEYFYLNREKPE